MNEPERHLREAVIEGGGDYEERSLRCLTIGTTLAAESQGKDGAVPIYLAAAQTYATLAVADALVGIQSDYRTVNPQ